MRNCALCQTIIPNRMVIDGKVRVTNTRKFCISCSPFGGRNTSPNAPKHFALRFCRCGERRPEKFYGKKTRVCAKCHLADVVGRRRKKRTAIIEMLGGKCASCGYDKHQVALSVHHKDPSIKDEHFARHKGWSIEKIKRELRSCVLLCMNCHTAYHAGDLISTWD
jgi:hypothetical protein